MTLKYYTKNVYGKPLNYLVTTGTEAQEDAGQPAQALLALIGTKTIDARQMEICKMLNINFERVFEPQA